MARKSTGGTPATVALTRAGVAFTLHEYAHDPRAESFGLEAAEALGLDPDRVFKTLLAERRRQPRRRRRAGQPAGSTSRRWPGRSAAAKAAMADVRRTPSGRPGTSPAGSRRSARSARTRPSSTRPSSVRRRSTSPAAAAASTWRSPRPTWSRSPGRSSAGRQSVVTRSTAWATSSSTQPVTPKPASGSRLSLDATSSSPASVHQPVVDRVDVDEEHRLRLVGLADHVLEHVVVAQVAVLQHARRGSRRSGRSR